MPKTYGFTKPYLLGQPDNISQGEAKFKADLAGDAVYKAFDIVEINGSGELIKATGTTGSSTRYGMANKDFDQPFATKIYRDRPEWIRLFGYDDNIVFQLGVAWAESLRGMTKQLVFNSTDKVLEVGSLGTNAAVRILYPVYEVNEKFDPGSGLQGPAQIRPEVGDLKVPVLCRWVEGRII